MIDEIHEKEMGKKEETWMKNDYKTEGRCDRTRRGQKR